jgi:hypothetical protein
LKWLYLGTCKSWPALELWNGRLDAVRCSKNSAVNRGGQAVFGWRSKVVLVCAVVTRGTVVTVHVFVLVSRAFVV